MGHAGASRKSPNDAPWKMLSLRLSRPISAPLLTVARSWRYEEENLKSIVINMTYVGLSSWVEILVSAENL